MQVYKWNWRLDLQDSHHVEIWVEKGAVYTGYTVNKSGVIVIVDELLICTPRIQFLHVPSPSTACNRVPGQELQRSATLRRCCSHWLYVDTLSSQQREGVTILSDKTHSWDYQGLSSCRDMSVSQKSLQCKRFRTLCDHVRGYGLTVIIHFPIGFHLSETMSCVFEISRNKQMSTYNHAIPLSGKDRYRIHSIGVVWNA